jgi:hypothetical protein
MTASRPDLKVLAVGAFACADWIAKGGEQPVGSKLVLCEAPADSAAALPVGCERDWCSPGFVVDVTLELVHAGGIKHAGGRGVAALARRWREQRDRANRLAVAVADVGKVLADTVGDAKALAGDYSRMDALANGLSAISEVVESCAPDVCGVEPSKAARDVLAAHGWREGMFPARIGKPPHNWVHTSGDGFAHVDDGRVTLDASFEPPAVLRAFATVAEETQP